MSLVISAVASYGWPTIPELSEDAEGALKTRVALQEMEHRFAAARLDVIVIASPHSFRVSGAIMLADARRAAGTLHWNHRSVEMNLPLDAQMTASIVSDARGHNIPIATG